MDQKYKAYKKVFNTINIAFCIANVFSRKEKSFEHILISNICDELNRDVLNYKLIDDLIEVYNLHIKFNILQNTSQEN